MSTRLMLRDRWRRGQRDWPASFPFGQLPHAPLLVALGGLLVAALTDGSVHAYARAAFYAGLAAWASEELAGSVNRVRRALGATGVVYVVVKVGAALGTWPRTRLRSHPLGLADHRHGSAGSRC